MEGETVKVSKLDRLTKPIRDAADAMPFFHWGRSPFAPPDEADGAHVGHMTLRRAPDGTLVGFLDDPKKETN
ncbi:MAG: hypothetical protein ACHQ01_01680 [Candidatus Limnocylindrales bacterium]